MGGGIVVASSSRRSPWPGGRRRETRRGRWRWWVATGACWGVRIVCVDASGAFSRARVAASHTGVRQNSIAVQQERGRQQSKVKVTQETRAAGATSLAVAIPRTGKPESPELPYKFGR